MYRQWNKWPGGLFYRENTDGITRETWEAGIDADAGDEGLECLF